MSTTVRDIPPPRQSPSPPASSSALNAITLQRRVIVVALLSSVVLSLLSTVACVISAMQPATAQAYLIAVAVGCGAEAIMSVGKHALRIDARSVHAWLFALADTATNAAGVYWAMPGLAALPGIAHGLAVFGINGQAGQVIVSLLTGFALSIAQPFLVAMLEWYDAEYGGGGA